MHNDPMLSIIVCVFNEAKSIEMLYLKLKEVLRGVADTFEVIFIDDGSTDNSLCLLENIKRQDMETVRIISFVENFGQAAAITAGFHHARGEVAVTIDADLQNDPGDIFKLLKKINEGYDLVTGWRLHRKDPLISKVLPSVIANKIIRFVTGVQIHDCGCGLKACRREVYKRIKLSNGMHRFISHIVSHMGYKVAEISINHNQRFYDRSKYGMGRIFNVLRCLMLFKLTAAWDSNPEVDYHIKQIYL